MNIDGTVMGAILALIGLLSWVVKKTTTWVTRLINRQLDRSMEEIHSITQEYRKSQQAFIDHLKEEARFRNRTWSDITEAITNLTAEIRELRKGRN